MPKREVFVIKCSSYVLDYFNTRAEADEALTKLVLKHGDKYWIESWEMITSGKKR